MNRPKVVVLNSASVDGRVAISPDVLLLYGDPRWQAIDEWSPNTDTIPVLDWLRLHHKPQATLEGSGSLIREGDQPEPLPPFEGDPTSLYQDFLPKAITRRPGHRGWFTAVDSRGRVRWMYKEGDVFGEAYQGWYALVWVTCRTPPEYLAYLQRENIPYLVAGKGEHVDLGLALEKMHDKLGVTSLLSTAGGRMNGALLRAGLVDEVNVEFLPALIGGFQTPSLFDSPELAPDELPAQLHLLSAQAQAGGRVWLRYRVITQENSV